MTILVPEPQVFGSTCDPTYPGPAELLHVSIYHSGPGVEDMIAFYGAVLNMRLVYRLEYPEFDFIALSQDDENHRVGIVNCKVDRDAQSVAKGLQTRPADQTDYGEDRLAPLRKCRVEHTSWLYHRFEDILLTAKKTHEKLGIWPRTSRHSGGGLTVDYNDPDGNRVELVTQKSSRAQALQRIHERLTPQGGAEAREYTDTYTFFSMEKMIGLWDSGIMVETLDDRTFVKRMVAEGRL